MKWVKQTGMPLKPYSCAACGSTPMEGTEKGEDSSPKPAYFREGVDINWGDSLYLCDTCVRILGELRGMISVEEAEKLKRKIISLEKGNASLSDDLSAAQGRIDRMLDGVKAKKEAQQARAPKKKVKTNA